MTEHRPLAGRQIVVTRATHQAAPLEALIRAAGGIPIAFPCIAIAPADDTDALDRQLGNLHQVDWLALTSSNALRSVVERARAIGVEPQLARTQIATVGPATSAELRRQLSRDADFTPGTYSAESLARQLPLAHGQFVLLPQSDLADNKAAETLRSRGAKVSVMVAYHTVAGSGGADLPALIDKREIDALTFASPSALRFFRRRCPLDAALSLPAFCLGPATTGAAEAHGFQKRITAASISLDDLINALSDYFGAP